MQEQKPTAIILGGTTGLGREIALHCLERGIEPLILGPGVNRLHLDHELCDVKRFYVNLEQIESWRHVHGDVVSCLTQRRVTHLFWVSGVAQTKPLSKMTARDVARLTSIHVHGPLIVLRDILNLLMVLSSPLHFVVISSTSAFKRREGEEIYCAVQAAKAMFAAQMAGTLHRELPGSMTTLVMPGGMNTPFWKGTDKDASAYMDPAIVAGHIFREVMSNTPPPSSFLDYPFNSLVIARNPDGSPHVYWRIPTSEFPY